MPTLATGNRLAEQRPVTVILRLVVDTRGQLVHGEVVDEHAMLQSRFVGWRGLNRALRAWLANQLHDGMVDDHLPPR